MIVNAADQPEIIEKLLNAHPDKRRLIYVHVPKCAGTDLSANLSKLYPAAIHHTLSHPGWTPPDTLQGVVDKLELRIAEHDSILVHGHLHLRWVHNLGLAREQDQLFTVVREPKAVMLSQINYIIGALMRDPDGNSPDTKGWLHAVGVDSIRDLAPEAIAEAVMNIVQKNPITHYLGNGTADSAIALLRASDIELSDLSRYKRWAEAKWNVPFTSRMNVSRKIVEHLPPEAVEDSCSEDMRLHATVMKAMGDDLMIRGSRL